MDPSLTNTIVSTGGAVIVGIFGMFFANNQIGKRLDDFGKRLDDLRQDSAKNFDSIRQDLRDLTSEFHSFKDTVNGKFAQLDLEISKLMDK